MTITASNQKLDFIVAAFDRDYDNADEVFLAAGQVENHACDDSRHEVMATADSGGAISIGNTGSSWIAAQRVDVMVEDAIVELRWSVWGTHAPSSGGTCQVRFVEDPDGAATVRSTQTLPNGTGTLPLLATFSTTEGAKVFELQIFNDDATAGSLDASVVVTKDL